MDTKTKLVHAAIAVFKKYGLEQTKVSDIVKEAGLAQGTFYLYFPSKLAIMPSIAQDMIAKMEKQLKLSVNPQAPLREQLSQLVDALFVTIGKYRDVLAFLYTGLSQSKDITKWETLYAPIYNWLTAFLVKHRQQLRPQLQAQHTARILLGCIEEAAEQVYLFNQVNPETIALQKQETCLFIAAALGVSMD